MVHRDRDYMAQAEVDEYKEQIHEARLEPFVTEGTDMECYFLSADHIHHLAPDLSVAQLGELIREATEESRDKSIERFINSRHNVALKARNRGGGEPNPGRIAREVSAAYDENPSLYRYGKHVQGILKAKVQLALGRNVEHCQVTPALSVPALRAIADEFPRQ